MQNIIICIFSLFISVQTWAQEIFCDNGIDDDNNGLIDCLDPTCNCDGCSNKWGDIWQLYRGTSLDFSTNPPTVTPNSNTMPTNSNTEACATVADENGNLLFYTNGVNVWDRNNSVMNFGVVPALLGGSVSSTQVAVTPNPANPNQYFIFTVQNVSTGSGSSPGLRMTTVDLSLNNGYGAISILNAIIGPPVSQFFSTEKIMTIRHNNCRDFWVIAHGFDSNPASATASSFYVYKVDQLGVTLSSTQNIGLPHSTSGVVQVGFQGYLVASSPDGSKLAAGFGSFEGVVDLFDFDNQTGLLSNNKLLRLNPLGVFPSNQSGGYTYGLEFSPDGNLLYVAHWFGPLNTNPNYLSTLAQYDITLATNVDIENSAQIIHSSLTTTMAAIKRGPDNRMYVASLDQPFLGVINQPNIQGLGCNFNPTGLNLAQTSPLGPFSLPATIPVIPPVSAVVTATPNGAVCPGDNVDLVPIFNGCDITNITWNDNLGNNLGNNLNIVVTPLTNILYTASIEYGNNCIEAPSYEVIVLPASTITINGDFSICQGESTTLTASGAISYIWGLPGGGTITGNSITVTSAGTYSVIGTNVNGCTATANISVVVSPAPIITITSNTTNCVTTLTANNAMSYIWGLPSGGGTSVGNPISVTTSGLYTVTGTDANGCTATASVSVTQPNTIILSITNTTPCFGTSTGTATATASGGNPLYTYLWSDTQTGPNAIGLAPGIYTVTVTDAIGCTASAAITMGSLPAFTVTQTVISTSINPNTVTIQQEVCSGTGNYTLQNTIPAGWTASGPINFTGTLTGGNCAMHSITLTLPSNIDLCELQVTNCVNLSSATCPDVQNCLTINTSAILGTTIIPPSILSFNEAIQNNLLLDLVTAQTTAQTVVFQGNIRQDVHNYMFVDSDITIAPNVQITIHSSTTLILNSTFVHGCGALWRSITLRAGAQIYVVNNSIIQDGFRAIEFFPELRGPEIIFTSNSTFRNNYIGIYAGPTGLGHVAAIIPINTLFDGGAILPSSFGTGNQAYTGLMVHDFPPITISNTNNIFQNLANGIVAYRTDITIDNGAIFRNILPRNYTGLPDGNGIYMENITFTNYRLSFTGLGQFANPTFNNCHNGIVSIASGLTVLNTNMTNIRSLGIESRLAMLHNISIARNNIALRSDLPAVAISLLQNDPTLATVVANNTLHIGIVPPPNPVAPAQRGIVVEEGSNIHPLTIIQNNIRLFREGTGIDITSNEGANVTSNGINLQQAGGALILRNGIRVSGSENVLLNCNNIGSTLNGANIFNGALGIDINNSIVRADCNDMTRTDIGMRINGPVCNGSIIRGNSFLSHNTGLLYTSSAITGQQNDAGNEWFGNWSNNQRGARHAGGPVVAGLSLYMVVPGQYLPPNVLPGNNVWFDPNGNTAATHLCPNTCTPPLLLAPLALNSVDVGIVNNQIPQNPAGLPWELRKGLYNKLDKNPNFQNISVMGQFYNTYQNQAIGAVVATTDDREEVLKIDSLDAVALEQLTIAKEFVIDSLVIVDSLYSIGILSQPNWLVHREYLLQQIIQNHQTATTLCNGLYGNCQAKNQQAQITNTSIVYTNTPEENEFLVNEIYLQTVASGNQHFSPAQIQTLYDIAHQCPDIGGTAIYRARSIYALIGFDTYDDDCDNLAQAKSGNLFNQDSCYTNVLFSNPSLEGPIGLGKTPPQWTTCTFSPDTGPLGISLLPSNGTSYLRIVAISGLGAKESLEQTLVDTLYKDIKYGLLLDAATCAPIAGFDPTVVNFSIWLGDSLCHKGQLIDIISTMDTLWHTYKVSFTPNKKYTHLVISAEDTSCNYIDNLRPISQPLCDSIRSIASVLPDKTGNTGNDVYMNITTTISSEFKVYPNPNTQGQLMVEWTATTLPKHILLIDALGRQIGNFDVLEGLNAQEVDIRNLPSGSYMVLLERDGDILGRKKLIVMKQ